MSSGDGYQGDSFLGNATTNSPSRDVTHTATFGLAGLLVFIIVVVVVVAARRKCRRSSSDNDLGPDPDDPEGQGHTGKTEAQGGYERPVPVTNDMLQRHSNLWNAEKWSHLADDVRCMLKGHVIESGRLRLGDVIGTGEFGCVFEARLFPVQIQTNDYCPMSSEKVAVKSLKAPSMTDEMVESFLKEGMIMRSFDHRNVLSLIGVALGDDFIPLIVLPFMQNGSLKKYIMNPSLVFTVRDLLSFGHQVAEGMKYLSEKKFVHRDLATRNCMLDENLVVKVADFGLSRDLYSRDYYASGNRYAKVPVRWMAPECLSSARYTIKSDVWSFGVLLWELLTRGSVPYSEIGNWDIQSYILSGQRLTQPQVCPDEIYQQMLSCWSHDPQNRPTFAEICEFYEMIIFSDVAADTSECEGNDYVNLTSSVEIHHHSEIAEENTMLLKKQ